MIDLNSIYVDIEWVSILALFSGASLLLSLLLLPYAATHFPAEYFLLESKSHSLRDFLLRSSSSKKLGFILRNMLAIVLFAAGLVMLFTPGQGLLTIMLALALLSFPGKQQLLFRLVQKPKILLALDQLRKRARMPAVILPVSTPDLYHLRSGNPENPALLCLHGFLGTGSDWIELLKSLNQDFFVLCPDLPGSGKSLDGQVSQTYSYDVFADALLRLLDRYEISSVHLLGYSMGARLALYLALRHPSRIRSLLLESVNPGIEDYQQRELRLTVDRQRAAELRTGGLESFLRSWYKADLFRSLATQPELLERLIQRRLVDNDPDWAAMVLEDLSPGLTPSLWPELKTISMPVLCLHGAEDQKYSEIAAHFKKFVPSAKLICLERAGHNLHLEKSEEFIEAVGEFIRGLERSKNTLEKQAPEC